MSQSEFETNLNSADSAVAVFERDDRTFLSNVRNAVRNYPTLVPALVLIVSILIFGIIAPRFLSPGVLSLVLQPINHFDCDVHSLPTTSCDSVKVIF